MAPGWQSLLVIGGSLLLALILTVRTTGILYEDEDVKVKIDET